MTTTGDRLRAHAARPLPAKELRYLPGFLAARVLQVTDIPRLLGDALASSAHATETISERAFSKRAVRRRLARIATGKRRASVPSGTVRALVRVPEWMHMGRSFFGMTENYYDPIATETLALLALWTGEGLTPRPGSCIIETSYHPTTDAVRNLLGWCVLENNWTAEQLEILSTLLRDGVEHTDAIEISRNPSW